MSLPKAYVPGDHETDIYALWEESGVFQPKGKGDAYTIVIPPPNANANLHIGFALVAALEDIATRYNRMLGKRTLLLPGADHAGFETQSVYEKHLAREGKSRFDFTREELYSRIYDFVALNRENFQTQFRRLGISCDWSKFTFTLDEKIVNQAYKTFKKMWDEELIYRGERLVNFCTFHGTAFADIEVEYHEEKGNLWYIRYPLVEGEESVVVATTRPETMLGDTAVAVHPNDERYAHLIGRTVKLPLTGREVPIIADEFVETEFGTGAVKITPAHDTNDFDCAERHALPKITVIDYEGRLNAEVPEKYRSMTVIEARQAVSDDLDELGVLEKVESLTHNVGHCYKCGTAIEPMLREQWFVDMEPLAAPAIEALKADKITFFPDTKRDQLVTYLENLRDWNISRQNAWGIPIPAFQNIDNPDDWIYDERVGEHTIEVDGKTYRRDPDVFDTWFSSSSWPYATLEIGSDDFKHHYPLSLMETGGEILYPWVSRMIMLGLYVTGEIPFKSVYIHGYVMAEDGSKMSKSVGNVVDPMPVIDEFGSDALRMGIIAGRSPGVNRGYDTRRIEDARNFCNKLWNIARYTIDRLDDNYSHDDRVQPVSNADHWIISRLNDTTDALSEMLSSYRFAEAYETLYHFIWDDLADWYIEASKSATSQSVMAYVLEQSMKLAHPFAPFVTEAIWQLLPWTDRSILATEKWPGKVKVNQKYADAFTEVQGIVTEIRGIVRAVSVRSATLYFKKADFIADNADVISALSGIKGVVEVEDGTGLFLTGTHHRCWLDIDPRLAESHVLKLEADITNQKQVIERLKGRLANTSYVKHAPKAVVAETEKQLEEAVASLNRINEEYERFKSF